MILFNTCSIIDAHPYPERKQNTFYHNIKTEIHRKKIRSFQHTIRIRSDFNLL